MANYKRTLYNNQNYDELLKDVASDKLSKDIKNAARELLSTYKSNFSKDEKEIREMFKSSKEFKQLYDNLSLNMQQMHEKIQQYIDLENDLSLVDDKSRQKYFELKEKLKEAQKIKNEIKKTQRSQDFRDNATADEKKKIAARKRTIEEYIKDQKNQLNLLHLTDEEINKLNQRANIERDIVNTKEKNVKLTIKANEAYRELDNQKKTSEIILQVWRDLTGVLKTSLDKWIEVDSIVYKTGRSTGIAASQLKGYRENIFANFDAMSSKLGMSVSELLKFQESYIKNTGRAILLTNTQVESIATMSKIVGESSVNEMTKNMDDFGASSETAIDYMQKNMFLAQASGLDAAQASESLAKNIRLASQYNFRDGIDGISRMVMLSQSLKFNLENMSSFIDKFSYINSAIETSARIQVLGGSFGANFGNPLEAMSEAYFDPENFIKRIIDTVKGQAIFNPLTGMVEMGRLEKLRLKEFANVSGINYNDLWNMVAQPTKIEEINKQLTETFNEQDKAFIANKATYNTNTKAFEINYVKNGETQTIKVEQLTKDLLQAIKGQEIPEKILQSDVRDIRDMLRLRTAEYLGDTKTAEEIKKGLIESMKLNVANGYNGINNLFNIKEGFQYLANNNNWATAILTGYAGVKLLDWVNRLGGQKFASYGMKGMTKTRGGLSSMMGKMKSSPKSLKLMVGSAIALGTIGLLTSSTTPAASRQQVQQQTIANNIQKQNDNNLDELEKQTELLEDIRNKTYTSNNQNNSYYTTTTSSYNEESNIASAIGNLGATTAYALPIAKKILPKSIGSKINPTKATSVLGWGTLAAEIGKEALISNGTIEENGTFDKLTSIALRSGEIAALGSMIAPGVGTAVGASVGALIGVAEEYGEDIMNWITGEEKNSTIMPIVSPNTTSNIRTTEVIGSPTYISSQGINSINNNNFSNRTERIELNISGTLKLTDGKTNNLDIDMNKLLDNPTFKKMIINMVHQGLNERANQGRSYDKNSPNYIMNGAMSRDNLNM